MAMLRVSTFVIVTGASRGIGRAIAIGLAKQVAPSSCLCLIARSKEGLEETAQLIRQEVRNETLTVRCLPADLSDEANLQQLADQLFKDVDDKTKFSHAIMIHNAASISDNNKYSRDLNDIQSMQKWFLLNVTSVIFLTSAFMQTFKDQASLRKTVVQVTSIGATRPSPTLHLYCMSKAGRDMFFRVMAMEEPEVKIMSFDPGFVDTAMYAVLQDSVDDNVAAMTTAIKNHQSLYISPEQAADAFIKALEEDKYESGATVRTYDVMNIDVDTIIATLSQPVDKPTTD